MATIRSCVSGEPTNRRQLGGTEGTREAVHAGRRKDRAVSGLVLRDGGRGRDHRLPVDCGDRADSGTGGQPYRTCGRAEAVPTCPDGGPVPKRARVLGLRLMQVHAVDGAAVHGGGALPGGLRPGRLLRDVGTHRHRRRGVGPL